MKMCPYKVYLTKKEHGKFKTLNSYSTTVQKLLRTEHFIIHLLLMCHYKCSCFDLLLTYRVLRGSRWVTGELV